MLRACHKVLEPPAGTWRAFATDRTDRTNWLVRTRTLVEKHVTGLSATSETRIQFITDGITGKIEPDDGEGDGGTGEHRLPGMEVE